MQFGNVSTNHFLQKRVILQGLLLLLLFRLLLRSCSSAFAFSKSQGTVVKSMDQVSLILFVAASDLISEFLCWQYCVIRKVIISHKRD